MSEPPVVDPGGWPGFERRMVQGSSGLLGLRLGGTPDGELVLLNHSILTGSAIWARTAMRLAGMGHRVACLDARGHDRSPAGPPPHGIDQLAADDVAVMDALGVGRAHVVGVSPGGMTGLALGVCHVDRLLSLCICTARADAPASFSRAWEDRIGLVEREGVSPLVQPTLERWFGAPFLQARPGLAATLADCIRETSPEGSIGCARAIQGLDHLERVRTISAPTTLVVGACDEGLLQPMRELGRAIPGARLSVIEHAGHLPQIDQPDAFQAILMTHLGHGGKHA